MTLLRRIGVVLQWLGLLGLIVFVWQYIDWQYVRGAPTWMGNLEILGPTFGILASAATVVLGFLLKVIAFVVVSRRASNREAVGKPTGEMRFAAAVFLVLEAVWAAWMIYRASEGGLSMLAYLAYFNGGILFGFALAAWVVSGIVGVKGGRERIAASLRRPTVRLQAAVLILVFIVVSSDAGFRLRLALSKPALRTVALATTEGSRSEAARWIGLFRVREVDAVSGAVRFITARCGLDDCGVVHSPPGQPPRVGEDSYYDLGGGWWYWHRSW